MIKNLCLLALCSCLLIVSCTQNDKNTGIVTIDIAEGLKNTGTVLLSELATDVELVQFEPRMETYFMNARSLSIGKKYIMIADDGQDRVILFTRDGKFVRHIGRQGKGPGEFVNPWESAMDPNDQFVFIHDGMGQKLIKYSTSGEFIKEISTEDVCYEEQFIDGIRFINDTQFVLFARRPRVPKEDFGSLPLFDFDMNLVKKILKRPKEQHLPRVRKHFNQGSDRMYFWEAKLDTLYTITIEGESIATHIVGCSGNSEKRRLYSVNEYGDYLFAYGTDTDETFSVVYNKETLEMFSQEATTRCDTSGTFSSPTIFNDLFGIEPVFINRFHPGIKRYIAWVRPGWIESSYDIECLREKQVHFPKIRDEIIRIAQDPEASQNMLMILLKPKK